MWHILIITILKIKSYIKNSYEIIKICNQSKYVNSFYLHLQCYQMSEKSVKAKKLTLTAFPTFDLCWSSRKTRITRIFHYTLHVTIILKVILSLFIYLLNNILHNLSNIIHIFSYSHFRYFHNLCVCMSTV